jgi:hypothetical protein
MSTKAYYSKDGNPKGMQEVSLTPGTIVNRRFRAGMRHDS